MELKHHDPVFAKNDIILWNALLLPFLHVSKPQPFTKAQNKSLQVHNVFLTYLVTLSNPASKDLHPLVTDLLVGKEQRSMIV